MKTKIATSILLVLLLGLVPQNAWAGPSVVIDGRLLTMEVPPQIVNDRVIVPMAEIFKELGAEVTWLPETQTILASKGSIYISLQVGDSEATVNGQKATLDCPPIIINGRTLVPLSFVAKSLNAAVAWDSSNEIVAISFPGQPGTDLTPNDIQKIVDPVIVTVIVYNGDFKYIRYANGVVIAPRKVLTSFEALKGGSWAMIEWSDKTKELVKCVSGYSKEHNAAILQLNPKNNKAVDIGDADSLQAGDKVVGINCPDENPCLSFEDGYVWINDSHVRGGGYESKIKHPCKTIRTFTEGSIKDLNHNIEGKYYFQTTVPIPKTSQGGFLFNMKGQLIGFASPKLSQEGSSFVMPIKDLKQIIDEQKTFRIDGLNTNG